MDAKIQSGRRDTAFQSGGRDYGKILGNDFSAQIPVETFIILDMVVMFSLQVDASVPIVLNGEKLVGSVFTL